MLEQLIEKYNFSDVQKNALDEIFTEIYERLFSENTSFVIITKLGLHQIVIESYDNQHTFDIVNYEDLK